MAVCPKCGSGRFHYELRSAGTKSRTNYYRTGVKKSWIIPSGQKGYRSQRRQKSIGICPECGYHEEKIEKGCLFYLLCLIVWPITVSVWFYKTKLISLEKKWRVLIIALFLIALVPLFETVNIKGSTSDHKVETINTTDGETSVWNSEYATLSDFEYYIDHNEIVLKAYKGHSKKVCIASSYDVDGVTMPVVALDGTFALKSVDSVIVPEGITCIGNNSFNSCGIKYLYLPASLNDFSGWSYFHNVEKIYYGGTEEQWDSLYTDERSRLDVVQIICNTEISELE